MKPGSPKELRVYLSELAKKFESGEVDEMTKEERISEAEALRQWVEQIKGFGLCFKVGNENANSGGMCPFWMDAVGLKKED